MKKILTIFLTMMFVMVGLVSAVHTSDVVISSDGWLEASTFTDFTVKVTNAEGGQINRVIIYTPSGYSGVSCGDAPSGWNLAADPYSDCTYTTTVDRIIVGSFKEFTLSATTSSSINDEWLVTSVDTASGTDDNDVAPTGLTISEAIEAAEPGDTINVPAGTYNENVIIENRNNIIIDGSEEVTIAPTSGIGFAIKNSDDITITGFAINTVGAGAHGIWIAGTPNGYGDSDGLVLENNIINIGGQSSGIYAEQVNPSHNGWEITGNVVSAPNLGVNIELYDVNDVTISGNTLEESGSVNLVYASEGSNVGAATISGNTFNGNGNVSGVTPGIWIESDFQSGDGNTAVNGVTITGNTFNDWTNAAIQIGETNAASPFSDVSSVVINENKFLKETLTTILKSFISETVNAENNWWSTANKDTIDALIDGNVDFTPWWYDETGSSTDLTAPEVTFSNTPYSGNPNEEILINITISDDSGITAYEIDWGDGSLVEEIDGGDETSINIVVSNKIYGDAGEYTITVTTTDIAGNEAIAPVKVSIYEPADWEIELYSASSNFIAIPFTPQDTDYKKVFDNVKGNLDKAWSYVYNEDTGKNQWVWMKYDSGWSRSTGFTGWSGEVVPGRGYIVFVSNDDVLYGYKKTISGDPEDTPVTPASVKLADRGYNLIGMFGSDVTAVDTALESLKSLASEKYWHKVSDKDDNEVTPNLQANVGYWLDMVDVHDSNLDYYYYKPY